MNQPVPPDFLEVFWSTTAVSSEAADSLLRELLLESGESAAGDLMPTRRSVEQRALATGDSCEADALKFALYSVELFASRRKGIRDDTSAVGLLRVADRIYGGATGLQRLAWGVNISLLVGELLLWLGQFDLGAADDAASIRLRPEDWPESPQHRSIGILTRGLVESTGLLPSLPPSVAGLEQRSLCVAWAELLKLHFLVVPLGDFYSFSEATVGAPLVQYFSFANLQVLRDRMVAAVGHPDGAVSALPQNSGMEETVRLTVEHAERAFEAFAQGDGRGFVSSTGEVIVLTEEMLRGLDRR